MGGVLSGLMLATSGYGAIVMGPYLQNAATNAMTVIWWLDGSAAGQTSRVEYGTGTLVNVQAATETEESSFSAYAYRFKQSARLTGLTADQAYSYRVYCVSNSNISTSSIAIFHPAPGRTANTHFAMMADGQPTTVTSLLAINRVSVSNALANGAQLILYAGDQVEFSSASTTAADDQHWKAFLGDVLCSGGTQVGTGAGSRIPVYMTVGNHEIFRYLGSSQPVGYPGGNLTTSMARYKAVCDNPANGSTNANWNERYYSFWSGPCCFLVLDLNNTSADALDNHDALADGDTPDWEPGSEQYQWMTNQLAYAQQTAAFTFVASHVSLYTRGLHGAPKSQNVDGQRGYEVRVLDPVFRKYGVDAFFSGHDHMVERCVTGPAGYQTNYVGGLTNALAWQDEANLNYMVNGNSKESVDGRTGWQSWMSIASNGAAPYYETYFYSWAGSAAYVSYRDVDVSFNTTNRKWRATFKVVRTTIATGVSSNFDEFFIERSGAGPAVATSVVAFATTPVGLKVVVDGATNATPCAFVWTNGTAHTISAPSPQLVNAGTQLVWQGWSNGGARTNIITAAGDATYTAAFKTQYLWTASANPASGGSVLPAGGVWYDAGSAFTATASAAAGRQFTDWMGTLTGSSSNLAVTMDRAVGVSANFSVAGAAFTAEAYGNFITMGVALGVPAGYTPSTIGTVQVFQVRSTGDRRLLDPVQVGSLNAYASSVFDLQPGSNYTFRAFFYNTGGVMVSEKAFSGSTRPEPGPVAAPLATIHVATNGLDTNPGTEAQPLRTLGQAFTNTVLAGTHIIMHGGVYYESASNPPPGVASNGPAVVVTAAPGETVVMDGSDESMFQSGWTDLGGGYYSRPFEGQTWLVCFRNKLTGTTYRCYPVATLGELMGKYSGVASKTFARYNITGAFQCSGTTLTIYCPAFKPGGDVEMRVSVRDTAIEHWQNHNIVYEGLAFRFYDGKGIYVDDSDDVIIRNCSFQYVNTPIGLKRASSRLLVEGCEFTDDCTRWGFLPKGDDGYLYHGKIETGAVNVYAPYDGRGLVFRNNRINGLFDGMHISPASQAPVPVTSESDFYSNTVVRVLDDLIEVDGFARNVRIFRNTMQHYLTGISIAQAVDGPTYVLYNILGHHGDSTAASIDKFTGFPVKTNGGDDYGTTAYAFFYHNTCWTPVADTPGFKVLHAQWRKLVMANNIWYGTYGGWNVYRAVPLSPVIMSRDIVWQEGGPFYHQDYGATKDYWTQASVATSGLADIQFLTNAVVAAPNYLGPAYGDFGLSAGSPAIDAGVVVPGVDDESYRGAAPDIGAIEYAVPVGITVATLPAGLSVVVSGVTNTAPQARSCSPGSVYTVDAPGPQPGGDGTQYVFAAWSDGGAQSHDITINASTNYTAVFTTQYLWTAAMNPEAGAGTVAPAGAWVDHGADFTATAAPLPGWTFVNWTRAGSGEVLGAATNLGVAMTGACSVVANFQAAGKAYTIRSAPQAGLTMVVDGVTITNIWSFSWASNTVHTIAVVDPAQPVGAAGGRFLWQGWSDGGTHSHSVTAAVDSVITSEFKAQYQWLPSVNSAPGGTVTPLPGWYDSGTVFPASALASPGYAFAGWSGDYIGADPDITVTMDQAKRAIATFMAVRFVDARATGGENGATWATAYRTLTNALAQAAAGQQIWVATGTYKPVLGTNRTVSFVLKSDVELYGGFAGTESLLSQRRWTSNPTVLSGDIDNDGQVTAANTLQVVLASQVTNAVLDGFTIVQGCNNTGYGGGMGIIGGANVVVRRCVFDNNTASRGGAVYIQSDCLVSKCIFRDNTAVTRGGAVYVRSSSPRFENSVFFRNSITSGDSCGGAIALYDQPVTMVSCSFAGNDALLGKALYLSGAAEGYAKNCIFWDSGDHGGGIWVKSPLANPGDSNFATLMSVAFSDVNGTFNPPQSGVDANNISTNPLFVAAGSGDLHLQAGSPCIGMANPVDMPVDDLDGNPRTLGAGDLGAYEYVSPAQGRGVWLATAPAGLLVVVDGVTNTAPQSVIWTNSDAHVIGVPDPQPGAAGTRYAFAAWSDGGAQTHSVTNPAATNYLAQFTTQHLFTASVAGNGAVSVTNGWYDAGSSATVTASADPYYHFTNWSGDVPGGVAVTNPLSVPMDQPKAVSANFAASLTLNTQTPLWWLAQYGWSSNFEQAATNDTDKDMEPAWQEYLSDTIPTNGDSCLRLTAIRPGAGKVDVQWLGGTSVVQYLEQGDSATSTVWQRLFTNLPPTSVAVSNSVTIDPSATQLFYRVRTVR